MITPVRALTINDILKRKDDLLVSEEDIKQIANGRKKLAVAFIKNRAVRGEVMDQRFKDITICSKCGSRNLKVRDSRLTHGVIRRRRNCSDCGNRMSSYEISKEDFDELFV